MMEKERRRDKESLYLRIGAIEDKLESEKNDKKNIINSFEEKMKSKNTELVEVKADFQKMKNIKDTFEKDIKSKGNEIAEMKIELKRVNNLIEEETSSRIFFNKEIEKESSHLTHGSGPTGSRKYKILGV